MHQVISGRGATAAANVFAIGFEVLVCIISCFQTPFICSLIEICGLFLNSQTTNEPQKQPSFIM